LGLFTQKIIALFPSTSPYQKRAPAFSLPVYGDGYGPADSSYSTQISMSLPNSEYVLDQGFAPAVPPPSSPKKQERIFTKKQMQECSELFQKSERLTKVDKAQIIQFLSGHQENPNEQEGPVKRFPLYEETETIRTEYGDRRVLVEYFFELNYATGQAQKIAERKS